MKIASDILTKERLDRLHRIIDLMSEVDKMSTKTISDTFNVSRWVACSDISVLHSVGLVEVFTRRGNELLWNLSRLPVSDFRYRLEKLDNMYKNYTGIEETTRCVIPYRTPTPSAFSVVKKEPSGRYLVASYGIKKHRLHVIHFILNRHTPLNTRECIRRYFSTSHQMLYRELRMLKTLGYMKHVGTGSYLPVSGALESFRSRLMHLGKRLYISVSCEEAEKLTPEGRSLEFAMQYYQVALDKYMVSVQVGAGKTRNFLKSIRVAAKLSKRPLPRASDTVPATTLESGASEVVDDIWASISRAVKGGIDKISKMVENHNQKMFKELAKPLYEVQRFISK
jgi:predicted transcriptional regulator